MRFAPFDAAEGNSAIECCSCSSDGSCIVWDLQRECRLAVMRAHALFTGSVYHPDGSQVVTVGEWPAVTQFGVFDSPRCSPDLCTTRTAVRSLL